ncbi:N-carbamoylsarcosine amidohydrolase [Novosphingobium cyanobacteriorum]|uniref:N-carbamoylsarcosine amidohydrolase n=1 Tax=Novosphingobium cyanobacteriorum TaxID=3024215 RepID=A0ABT6CLJ3_9SPHN|nr:N-carbamoylsarcosine amidohydrolase [Novosphingobium cyanobacteriorum]MDF8334666.1 N-carbamoylsarcosine amidohydrolase [Novosphingobium cyanobacteriorum]
MGSGADDLAENYKGAFDGRLPFGQRPALVIVDLVEAYLQPDSPLYAGIETALASAVRLREAAHTARIPVIFTNVEYAPAGADGGVFYRKVPALRVFERGSPLGAFPPSLSPEGDDLVITKRYASAFFGTHLAATLTSLGVDTVLICGTSTSGCIRATALDACQHGFLPFVVRDACGDRHSAPHEANLFDLQAKYAEVISEAEAAAHLSAT